MPTRDSRGFGFYFDSARDRRISKGTQHYHSSFEIYYLKSGACSYFIDKKSYEIKAGDLVLIPEGVIHKTMYNGTPHTRQLINCSSSYIPTSVFPKLPSMLYLYRNPEIKEELSDIFSRIEKEYEKNDIYTAEALEALSYELFFLLARNIEKKEGVEVGSIFVEQTVSYIQKNYMEDISLSEMARLRSVSAEHLSRTFKKETGFGFSEYLTLVRLQRAEYMLKNEPGRSIAEVAYACGFNDSNYFSEKFKRAYGISPSKIKGK